MDSNTPKHILIIEDDAFFSELLARGLTERGFRVTTAERMDAAERLLKDGNFDVVCLDVVVSDDVGMKSASEIKTGSFFKNIPLLLLINKEQEEGVLGWGNEDEVAYAIKNESSPDEIISKIIGMLAPK